MKLIVCIVSLVIAIAVVNGAYNVFMKIMGADGMFFSVKKKMIAIFIVWVLVLGSIVKIFGL